MTKDKLSVDSLSVILTNEAWYAQKFQIAHSCKSGVFMNRRFDNQNEVRNRG